MPSTFTPRLSLPNMASGEASGYVTFNELARILDALVQPVVQEEATNTPPGTPNEGDMYIVGSSPTDDFVGHAGELAVYYNSTWEFFTVFDGMQYYIDDINQFRYPSWLPTWVEIDLTGESGEVPLTQAQAFTGNVKLIGALTSDVSIVWPDEVRTTWIYNGTTGDYSVTAKPLGSGNSVPLYKSVLNIIVLDGSAGIDGFPMQNPNYPTFDVAGSSDLTLTGGSKSTLQVGVYGALTGDINVIWPDEPRLVLFHNNTSGNYEVNAKPDGGTAVPVAQGTSQLLSFSGGGNVQIVNEEKRKYVTKDVGGGTNVTLNVNDYTAEQLTLTGTLTADIDVLFPDAARTLSVYNNTSGAYTVTVKPTGGSGVSITQGNRCLIGLDGNTNAYKLAAEV